MPQSYERLPDLLNNHRNFTSGGKDSRPPKRTGWGACGGRSWWVAVAALVCGVVSAAAAPVMARYVRLDNPTGPGMCLQEIEVFSDGENVALGKGEEVRGTWKIFPNRKPIEGRQLVDGDKDTGKRGPGYVTPNHEELGPWVEIDLGGEMPIDRILVYGSSFLQFLDKGERVLTLLDDQRRVVWASKWNAFNAEQCPNRIRELDVAGTDGASPMNGQVVAEEGPLQVSMEWLVADLEPERRPDDAEERLERISQRFSPQAQSEVADELFLMLDPNVPELAKARELYAQKKPAEALEEYKRYWFAKMARENLKKAHHVLPPSYVGQADDLLNGLRVVIGTVGARGPVPTKAMRFTTGAFPWVVLPENEAERGRVLEDGAFLANVNNLQRPLLLRYDETGDKRYLEGWAALMDDWSMNFAKDADASPYNVRDNLGSPNAWSKVMEDLANIAEKRPEMIDLLPAATLARMQLRCLDEYGPPSWRQGRETAFNHNVSNIQSWTFIVPYIREFLPGQRIEREWRQHMERWMTLFMEPDGSMVEIGDEGHFPMPMFLGYNWKWFEETKPEWFTPGWRNRAWDMLDQNQLMLFRHVAPGGADHRFDHRLYADRLLDLKHPSYYRPGVTREDYPDRSAIHRIPEVRRILDTVFAVSADVPEPDPSAPKWEKDMRNRQRNHRAQALKVLGDDRPGQPKISSDWMPYTGSYYFRGGWDEGNVFLAMLARNSRGGSEPNWGPATWSYGLVYAHDYSFPLMRAETPRINGLHQNTLGDRISYQPGSKTGSLTYAERDPAQHRWHDSERFAFGEAVFDGGYRKFDIKYKNWLYGPEPSELVVSDDEVRDVRANRMVHQLRQNRLFILTDAIHFKDPAEAANLHTFDVDMKMMLSALKDAPTAPFNTDQLVVDEDRQVLTTQNPDGPNVTLYQFGSAPLSYSVKKNDKLEFNEYSQTLGSGVGISPQEISASWEAKGDATVVTLMATSPRGEPGPVRSFEPLPGKAGNVVGFHAVLTDGREIWYQASSGQPAPLVCGPFSMTGESLLVTRDKAGEISGIGLGGSDLRSGGTAIQTPGPDFEFVAAAGGAPTFTPIYRPILSVRFNPDINTFIDQLTVEMTSETPNVEIRYTTDGTPPTRESTLYTGPITITESTEFAARAYRLGPDGKPLPAEDFEINGTKFTLPSYGWFYKEPLRPAAAPSEPTKPGLLREKLAGNWRRLYGAGHWLPAEPAGVVSEVMDLNGAKSDDYYGVRFKGYLTVPADGVYTFYAPREFVLPDVAASYDLRVYVDGEEWDLTQWWHGHGTWSIPLAKGPHRFEVDFMDARTTPWRKSGLYRMYPRPWVEHQGDPTPLMISGPGIEKQTIPASWLLH